MIYITELNKTISDLNIILFGILILFLLYKKKIITKKNFFIFFGFLLTPLFFNGHLIDPFSLWDQIAYVNRLDLYTYIKKLNEINYHKTFDILANQNELKVNFFSFFHSLFFFLYKESINSIALINKLLLIFSLILIHHKKKIKEIDIYILLIIPSTIFYSSVSLKETFIIAMTILCIYFYDEKKLFLLIIFFLILYLVRLEYSLIIFINLILIFLFQSIKKNQHYIIYSAFILLLTSIFFTFDEYIFKKMSHISKVYNLENSGWHAQLTEETLLSNFSLNIFDLRNFFQNIDLYYDGLYFTSQTIFKIFFLIEFIVFILIIIRITISNQSNKFKTINSFVILPTIIAIFFLIPNIFLMHRYIYCFLIFYFISSRYRFSNTL